MEENQTLKTENPEKKKPDYWQIVITVIAFSCITSAGRIFFGGKILFAILAGALGGGLGGALYNLVKNKKTSVKLIAVIAELAVFCALIMAAVYFKSDKYAVKKQWNVYKFGTVSFAYPEKFDALDVGDEVDDDYVKMRFYMANEETRLAAFYIYDFKDEKPAPEDSLSGAVLSIAEDLHAENLEWIEPQFYDDAVLTDVKYTVDKKERNGFAFIFFEENHYELLVFLPYTKDYSPEFIQKIKENIFVD